MRTLRKAVASRNARYYTRPRDLSAAGTADTPSVIRLVAVVAAVIALSSTSANAGSPTRSQWVTAANAVCAKGFAVSHTVINSWSRNPPSTVSEWVTGLDRIIAAEDQMRRKLRALPRPAQDRARIETMIAWLDQEVRQTRLMRRAELARDIAGYRAHLAAANAAGKKFTALADQLGATICAHG